MLLTVQQVAERYGVSQHRVLAWIHSGQLRAINVARKAGGPPRWRVLESALTAFEALRSAEPAPSSRRRKSQPNSDTIKFY